MYGGDNLYIFARFAIGKCAGHLLWGFDGIFVFMYGALFTCHLFDSQFALIAPLTIYSMFQRTRTVNGDHGLPFNGVVQLFYCGFLFALGM